MIEQLNSSELCNDLKGLYHQDIAVKGEFCAEVITLIIQKNAPQ